MPPLTDIHCHLLPGIDDGAKDWHESLAMARMAADDGLRTIIATPHQLGQFGQNGGDTIRALATELQERLARHAIPLRVLPGADVRIEPNLVRRVAQGDVVSLGDHRRHVLLELPHELYVPLDRLLEELAAARMVGVLSHPERNLGLLAQPQLIGHLVDRGCLMQVTAGSYLGTFGPGSQQFAEWMTTSGCVHFVSTDAHGTKARRPLLSKAFQRVAELAGEAMAIETCAANPAAVAAGSEVRPGRREVARTRGWSGWFTRLRAG